MAILTSNSKLDIWLRSGHRIHNGTFGPEPILEPGPIWTQANLDPGLFGPGTGDPGKREYQVPSYDLVPYGEEFGMCEKYIKIQ